MKIKPINKKLEKYLKKHHLKDKFEKAVELFEEDYRYPSLQVEILEPKHLKIYSFRIDKKYRAIFVIVDGEAEIIAITNHYD